MEGKFRNVIAADMEETVRHMISMEKKTIPMEIDVKSDFWSSPTPEVAEEAPSLTPPPQPIQIIIGQICFPTNLTVDPLMKVEFMTPIPEKILVEEIMGTTFESEDAATGVDFAGEMEDDSDCLWSEEWYHTEDENSGLRYYFNPHTGESQWEPPLPTQYMGFEE